MTIEAMNHFTVLTRDLAATEAFYVGVLGLRLGPRPPFAFPGAWLYLGDAAVLHIIVDSAPPAAGVIDHVAFSATGLAATAARLKAHGIDYQLRRQAAVENGPWQLFCFDPNGAKLELDFAAEEPAPAAG